MSFNLSFSLGISNTHLNLESINSSGFASFHTTSISEVFSGAKIVPYTCVYSFHSDHSQRAVALLKQSQLTLGQ
uniref:Uncharacterized protein n=1 Tax=Theropithecus gelada TaxID=9565 RepID=A0A8D2JY46_THEGE